MVTKALTPTVALNCREGSCSAKALCGGEGWEGEEGIIRNQLDCLENISTISRKPPRTLTDHMFPI